MIVAVLGQLVLDEIHPHDGGVVESLGGIFFPVGAFGALADTDDTVYPMFPIGDDAWEQFCDAATAFPGLDLSLCQRSPLPNTRVRLFHDAHAQYNTQLVRSLPPLDIRSSESILRNADLIYLNMMTGHDVLIEDAERLRSLTSGRIYLDLHMVAYKVALDGHRSTSPVPDWERWVNVPHVLQCNDRELSVLGDPDWPGDERIERLFRNSTLDNLIVTHGERGSSMYNRTGSVFQIPSVPTAHLVDSTGCGDVFGSTVSYHLAKGFPLADAGLAGARAAAFVASIPGSVGIASLRQHLMAETK